MDIWGPTFTPDLSGNRYVIGAACYTASEIVGDLLQHNSDAPSAWTEIFAFVASFGHNKPRRIRIDDETVLLSSAFKTI